jgi:hypothetical protein
MSETIITVSAGSQFGHAVVNYTLEDGKLKFSSVEDGSTAGLSGNEIAYRFAGLTPAEAQTKAAERNAEPRGERDYSHYGMFSVRISASADGVPLYWSDTLGYVTIPESD